MAALQFADVPGYAALLLRRTYADLALPGALMDTARSWLSGTDARWSETEHAWRFPAGASLAFGHVQNTGDEYRYASAEFQFIGFDETTQFTEQQYRFMFSRLRGPAEGVLAQVPLRMRAASNPGGPGHDWVKQRFLVEGREHGRIYLPARLRDNPSLNADAYEQSLAELDPVTRAQLLNGDWSAAHGGSKFQRQWFSVVDEAPRDAMRYCRFWDMATTEAKPGTDPDFTAGALVGLREGVWYLLDMRRMRARPGDVEAAIKQCAVFDPPGTSIRMEQEPGASGVALIDHYRRRVLVGRDFDGLRSTGNKEVRANPVSAAASAGNVKIVRAPWNTVFLDEAEAFPLGSHDDQVDALSGAFSFLWRGYGGGGGRAKKSLWTELGSVEHRGNRSGNLPHRGQSVWV